MIFVDSSAIVAMLAADPDAAALAGKLESDSERISGAPCHSRSLLAARQPVRACAGRR